MNFNFNKYDNSKAEVEIYKDIRNLITELKKVSSTTRFDRLAADLNNLYSLANQNNLYEYPIVDDYIARKIGIDNNDSRYNIFIKNYKKLFNLIEKDIDYHLDFANNYLLFDECDFQKDYHELNYVEDKEIIYYAEEFMASFDQKLFNNYRTLVNSNHILLNDYDETGLGGLFTPLYNNKKPYLTFYLNNNIDDASTIVHESAHLRQFDLIKNNQTSNDYNYLFREVYSYYLQFVFYDYLKNKKIYEKDIDTCFNHCLGNLNEYFISLEDDLNNMVLDNIYLYNDLQYTYGITIALKYFDIYKSDPEYAKLLINNFIEQSYYYEPLQVMNSFGLDNSDIKNGEIIKKYLKK